MNTTTELLNELIKLNKQHIQTLNERIEVLQQTIKIQNKTINNYLNIKSHV
jgi:DNA-binding protein H-NS